jgi:hypothetical protein
MIWGSGESCETERPSAGLEMLFGVLAGAVEQVMPYRSGDIANNQNIGKY